MFFLDDGARQNIFSGSWRWPKTLVDFAVFDARLAVTWRGPDRKAKVNPFGRATKPSYLYI
jgi:hypothetical protein